MRSYFTYFHYSVTGSCSASPRNDSQMVWTFTSCLQTSTCTCRIYPLPLPCMDFV